MRLRTLAVSSLLLLSGSLCIVVAFDPPWRGIGFFSAVLVAASGLAGLFLIFFGLTYPLLSRERPVHWSKDGLAERSIGPYGRQRRDREGMNALERQEFYYEGGEHYVWPKPGDPSAPPLDKER